jgi:CRISPR-associated protein Cmr6
MFPNLGYIFYQQYYEQFIKDGWKSIIYAKTSKDIELTKNSKQWVNEVNKRLLSEFDISGHVKQKPGPHGFNLKTTYPGLAIGIGYNHETGIKDEFKTGFYFDHTTGLPVIPGSTVKGILRSVFPKRGTAYTEAKESYIKDLLNKRHDQQIDVEKLEEEIFDGLRNKKPVKQSQRDIFFDARIIPPDAWKGVQKKLQILGEDYITPHKNPLQEPDPIKILKVMPGITFRFDFRLQPNLQMDISAEEKEELFKKILLDIGAGAKTNIGYGQFEETTIN